MNVKISLEIIANVKAGMSIEKATDSVLGECAFKKIAYELHAELNK